MLSLKLLSVLLVTFSARTAATNLAYYEWLPSMGMQINAKVSLDSTSTGPTLLSAVKEGEILASIPSTTNTIFTLNVLNDYPALQQVLYHDEQLKESMTPTVALAVALMFEKQGHTAVTVAQEKEDFSKWSTLIENGFSDGASSSTLFWPENDLQMLAGTTVFRDTYNRMRAVRTMHEILGR